MGKLCASAVLDAALQYLEDHVSSVAIDKVE